MVEIKPDLNAVLASSNTDSLLSSEWLRLEDLIDLLEPFAIHTDVLQSDSLSLSQIIPSIINLQCHLQQYSKANDLSEVLYQFIIFQL